jgi:hypothetical protein
VYSNGSKNVPKTKTWKESPVWIHFKAKIESTLQHGGDIPTLSLLVAGNTSKPVDDKEATWSRDSELVRNLSRNSFVLVNPVYRQP